VGQGVICGGEIAKRERRVERQRKRRYMLIYFIE